MNRAARVRLTAGRQLVAAAAAGGERITLAEALAEIDGLAAEQPPAPRWRIETAAGAIWGHYAVAHTPADAANLERAARRAGHRTRIIDRRGGRVHVTHDASGACHLVTIPD